MIDIDFLSSDGYNLKMNMLTNLISGEGIFVSYRGPFSHYLDVLFSIHLQGERKC